MTVCIPHNNYQKAQGDAAQWPAPGAATAASSHASDYDVDRDVDYVPSHHRASSSVAPSDAPRRGHFEPVQWQDLETDYLRNAKEYERCVVLAFSGRDACVDLIAQWGL
jgi:hypothetical protein